MPASPLAMEPGHLQLLHWLLALGAPVTLDPKPSRGRGLALPGCIDARAGQHRGPALCHWCSNWTPLPPSQPQCRAPLAGGGRSWMHPSRSPRLAATAARQRGSPVGPQLARAAP